MSTKVLTIPQAERFCDTLASFKSVGNKPNGVQLQALRNAVREPGKSAKDDRSSSVFSRWCLFWQIHGRERFIDFFARGNAPVYSDYDYLRILEYTVQTGMPIDRAWVIFRCSRRKLEKLSAKRKKSDTWEQVEPAVPPEEALRILDSSALGSSQTDLSAQDQWTGNTIIAVGSTAKEPVEQSRPSKHIHGKSSKPVIALQRPPKKERRKDIEAAKKEQQAIAATSTIGREQLANMQQDALEKGDLLAAAGYAAISNMVASKVAKDIYDRFVDIKAELKSPADFEPSRRGRPPFFNPLMEGFGQLPAHVQKSSIAYFNLLEKTFIEAKDAAKQVPATASQFERFQACKAFITQHPEYPIKVAIIPFGFKYDNYKYYDKYRPRGAFTDPYLDTNAYQVLLDCFIESNGRFGKYRLRQMMYDRGYNYCIPTIAKLMKRLGLVAYVPSAKNSGSYSSYLGEVGTLSPNILQRDFNADRPFQKIVTDVTEFKVNGQKLYLSAFLDLFNNEIRAYSISTSPSTLFVVEGFKKLLSNIPKDSKCIIHSDQGHHYQREQYRQLFKQNPNLIQSMSRKGNCYDNGACESLFARIKEDVFNAQSFSSINELVDALERYISYYNNERIQIGLQGKSPVAYARLVAANEIAHVAA